MRAFAGPDQAHWGECYWQLMSVRNVKHVGELDTQHRRLGRMERHWTGTDCELDCWLDEGLVFNDGSNQCSQMVNVKIYIYVWIIF